MKINIVIPNYNGADLLEPCLDSIYLQNHKDFNVTVVDNGSTDNSYLILKKYSDRIKIIWLKENMGFSKAVNIGIKATDGDLVFLLNNDTILHPDCLFNLAEGIKSFPGYSSYAPLMLNQNNPNQLWAAGLMFSIKGYGNRSNAYLYKGVRQPQEIFGPCGGAAVYRRKALEEVGVFNERFFFFYEDLELSFRLQLCGHKCILLPLAVVYHHGSATLHKFFSILVYEAAKNSLITLITCMPTCFLIKYFTYIADFYIHFFTMLIKEGYFIEAAKALTYVAYNSLALFLDRKTIQRKAYNLNYLEKLLYSGKIYLNFPDKIITL